jgi:hypothetical protein
VSVAPILPIRGVPDELLQVLNDRFRGISNASAAEETSGGSGMLVRDLLLTLASTRVEAPRDAAGSSGYSEMVVILRQDGTGGRAVVWGDGFVAASTAIITTASTISVFRFVRSGSSWVMAGQPTTGMTI